MSLLPQRKKSPAEIAQLRESLGIPGVAPGEQAATSTQPPATAAPDRPIHAPRLLTESPSNAPADPARIPASPAPVHHGPKPVHSLKRSERTPILPLAQPPSVEQDTTSPAPHPVIFKPGRSLRKSEPPLLPAMPHAVPHAESNLPQSRHDEQELAEIRRREALAMLVPVAHPKLVAAHPALIIPGYLIALAGASPAALELCSIVFFPPLDAVPLRGASSFAFASLPITIPACCAAIALFIAGFIALKKPLSRHHAAFIAVITLFVIVFGALHFFPQLRNAT